MVIIVFSFIFIECRKVKYRTWFDAEEKPSRLDVTTCSL